jgi:hypothetical protein
MCAVAGVSASSLVHPLSLARARVHRLAPPTLIMCLMGATVVSTDITFSCSKISTSSALRPGRQGLLTARVVPCMRDAPISISSWLTSVTSCRFRYVERQDELQDVFVSLHLAEIVPDAIIIDSPEQLRLQTKPSSSSMDLSSPQQQSPQGPSPKSRLNQEKCNLMQMAAIIALSAHAADFVESARRRRALEQPLSQAGHASTAPPVAAQLPCTLCIGSVQMPLDRVVSSRWLASEAIVHSGPAPCVGGSPAPDGRGTYTLSCSTSASLIFEVAGRRLQMVPGTPKAAVASV